MAAGTAASSVGWVQGRIGRRSSCGAYRPLRRSFRRRPWSERTLPFDARSTSSLLTTRPPFHPLRRRRPTGDRSAKLPARRSKLTDPVTRWSVGGGPLAAHPGFTVVAGPLLLDPHV